MRIRAYAKIGISTDPELTPTSMAGRQRDRPKLLRQALLDHGTHANKPIDLATIPLRLVGVISCRPPHEKSIYKGRTMKECLVDVLNASNTVLHVFPIAVEDESGNPKAVEPEREALRLAALMQLVPETETAGMHARQHVSRGGQLAAYGDVLEHRQLVGLRL